MSESELFPHSEQKGITENRDYAEIVAYDLDGERYCVECAREHDEIDCERFHKEPRSVPHGGSVQRRHMHYTEVKYYCGNPQCGKKIPR